MPADPMSVNAALMTNISLDKYQRTHYLQIRRLYTNHFPISNMCYVYTHVVAIEKIIQPYMTLK